MKLIFDLMKRVDLCVAMEADVQDGKTFKEHEHEFYVEIEDFGQLKKAKSVDLQEQWNLKIDKVPGNSAKGALRIRQIYTGDVEAGADQKPSGKAQYVLTTKVNKGVGKRLEVPVPTTEDAFELFAMLSDSGMIKHRYHFPVDDLVFEVDMYLDPEGGYYPVAKVDLEVKSLKGEIPELPIKVKSCIMGNTKDADEKAKITQYYDDYFITKNKFLKKKDDDCGDHEYRGDFHGGTIVQEGMIDTWKSFDGEKKLGVVFFALIAGLNIFLWSRDKWKAYVKNKNKDVDIFDEDVRKIVTTLKGTFLNDAWVSKQKFKTGSISGAGIAQWLAVDGKFNPDVVGVVNNALATFERTGNLLAAAHKTYADQVESILKPVVALMLKTPPRPEWKEKDACNEWDAQYATPAAAKLFEDAEDKLLKLKHPAEAYWFKLPNAKNMVGGLQYSIDNKHDVLSGDLHFLLEAKPVKLDIDIPALTVERSKEVAKLIITLLESTKAVKGGVFNDVHNEINRYPCPADGWPDNPYRNGKYAHADLEELFGHCDYSMYDTVPYRLGSLSTQYSEPAFAVDYTFKYVTAQVAESLLKWLQKSIEGNSGE